jgi:manganese/zinc/iron transport system substrate-binding protein
VRVVASTPIVAELVREVGGGGVEVVVVVPVDQPISSLERTGPVESELIAADLVVLLGFGQEAVLAPSLARAVEAGAVVCELASGVSKEMIFSQPDDPAQVDPHIWLDPRVWSQAVRPIEDALAGLRPEWAAEWRNRAHAARFDLEETAAAIEHLARAGLPPEAPACRTTKAGLRYLARAAGVPLELVTDPAGLPRHDELDKLPLDRLRAPGTKAVSGMHEHDLGTVDGLRAYALNLLLGRYQ